MNYIYIKTPQHLRLGKKRSKIPINFNIDKYYCLTYDNFEIPKPITKLLICDHNKGCKIPKT